VSSWATAPLVVGHRGGRGAGWPPENTLGAFELARSQGATAIELDVRTCAGGSPVVFHDATLERMTGGRDRRKVQDVSLEELVRDVDLGGGWRVPTLAEVLAWANVHRIAVNVEMKHDVPNRVGLAREVSRVIGRSGADVLLSSFDPLLLAMASAFAPSVARSLLTQEKQTRAADALQEVVRPPFVASLHVERTQVRAEALARYARRGLRVGTWTVNDPAEARHFVSLGVATIITDTPGVLLEALTRT
jgi:glycerophosphoryl diester phosphodiesterase